MEDKRPNRSDTHLTGEEEAKIEGETRNYFDQLAPKRHTKPQRSEHSIKYVDGNHGNHDIPENVVFQNLEHDTQKLGYDGNGPTEEFVEIEYYKDLNGIDKQHHTTGTGFIKVENANGTCFSLAPDTDTSSHSSTTGNPATNDWTPAPNSMEDPISGKPSRSDS